MKKSPAARAGAKPLPVVTKPLSALTPASYNPRRWTKRAEKALAASLAEFGVVQPIVWNSRTKRVVGGHMRLSALRSAGQKRAPVVVVDLDERRERALNLALNSRDLQGVFTSDVEELLPDLLAGLPELSASLNLEGVLDQIAGHGNAEIVEDTPPEPPAKAVSKPGELWLLGEHRLLVGDSTKAEDVARVMADQKCDIVVADPPYGINLDTDWSRVVGSLKSIGPRRVTRGGKYEKIRGDDRPFDPSPIFTAWGYCREIFLFGADYYSDRIPCRLDGSWMVWDKRKPSQSGAIGSEFELIWSKMNHKRRILRHDWFGFLSSQNGSDARHRVHPTQKPVSLIADLLGRYSRRGSIMVDPYCGSGTQIVAAEQLSRRCFAIEISGNYVDVAVGRWQSLTGKRAKREDGTLFPETGDGEVVVGDLSPEEVKP